MDPPECLSKCAHLNSKLAPLSRMDHGGLLQSVVAFRTARCHNLWSGSFTDGVVSWGFAFVWSYVDDCPLIQEDRFGNVFSSTSTFIHLQTTYDCTELEGMGYHKRHEERKGHSLRGEACEEEPRDLH